MMLQSKRKYQLTGNWIKCIQQINQCIHFDIEFCSVMYGGVTISSSKETSIKVPTATKKPVTHKRPSNVVETLKKLKKMQTGMTISKTVVPAPKPIRRCKAERKFYGEEITDDNDKNGNKDDGESEKDFDGDDDDYYDPAFDVNDDKEDSDVVISDDSDDDDYNPSGKKSKSKTKSKTIATTTVTTGTKQSSNTINAPSGANSKFKAIKINTPPVFLCMKCKYKFDSLAELKQHVFQKNSCTTSQLTCKLCNKTFETRKRLNAHAKVHEEKPKYICDQCGKMYTNQFNLENHKSSQHGEYLDECENVYKCRICNEKFTNRTDLYAHMKTHIKDKNTECLCDTCGKCFNNPHNLRSHQKVHLDIRPFACELCPKRFRTRLLLRQHGHVHTGIKEFQCVHCLQSFAKQDSLRSHLKKRHPDMGQKPSLNQNVANQSQPDEESKQEISHSIENGNFQSNSVESTNVEMVTN